MSKASDKLKEFIERAFQIVCTYCSEGENCWADTDEDASKEFYRKGWRVIDGEPTCKECIKFRVP